MYCGKCGKQIKDGAFFCPNCGKAINMGSVDTEPKVKDISDNLKNTCSNQIEQTYHIQPNKWKAPAILGGIFIVIVLIVALLKSEFSNGLGNNKTIFDEVQLEVVSEEDSTEAEATVATEIEAEPSTEKIGEEAIAIISERDIDVLLSKFHGNFILEGADVTDPGAPALVFSDREYINGIFVTVYRERGYGLNNIKSFDGTKVIFDDDVILESVDDNSVIYDGETYVRGDKQLVDIGAEVEQIREWYYDTQNNIDRLLYAGYPDDIHCYFDGAYPGKVIVPAGYSDFNYVREYYYHDQKLYFVFAYNSSGDEHRIYVKDGNVIRHINGDSTVDRGYGMSQKMLDMQEWAINESDELFPTMINCGN
ncbi:MAG: zinc-ribbon domain-containing protein [Lachnospiraceae bacterium]|nr:zinc-ribbon domain-containing protein [Lachnospiraceae bacterium]